jgi:hypothetical protein
MAPREIFRLNSCHASLDELCVITLNNLRIHTRIPNDFLLAALEASRQKLIEEGRFRSWFTSYVRKRHEELLRPFDVDDNAARICSILISAVALSEPEQVAKAVPISTSIPFTPPSLAPGRKRQTAPRQTFVSKADDKNGHTPTKSKPHKADRNAHESPESAKKRKYATTMEEVPDEDAPHELGCQQQ